MTQVYLVQAPLRLRSFTRWALDRRYLSVPPGDGRGRPREPDLGYALHAALTGLFGEHAPRPFTLPPDRGGRHGSRLGGRRTDVVPLRGGGAEVVPIEALAPDAPMAGAREGGP